MKKQRAKRSGKLVPMAAVQSVQSVRWRRTVMSVVRVDGTLSWRLDHVTGNGGARQDFSLN